MQPFRFEYLTLISPTFSPQISFSSRISISAPICFTTSRITDLVGYSPTLRMIISEFGIISAATIKYAADDISPQISIFIGESSDL